MTEQVKRLRIKEPQKYKHARQESWDAAIAAAVKEVAAQSENWESLPAETRYIINLIAINILALKMPE